MMGRRRFQAILFALLMLLALGQLRARPARAVDALGYEAGQVVVRLAPGADIAAVNQLYGTTVLDTIPGQPDIYLLQAPPGANLLALVQLLAGDPQLALAELNYLTADPESGSTNRIYGWTDETQFKHQTVRTKIDLDGAHAYTSGQGALIAVLDTGIQRDHPELAGSISGAGFDFVDGDTDPSEEANGVDEDLDGQVDEGYGHGTHVAGIAHLVAPEATLLPLRVLNSDSRGNTFKAAAAVYYAAASGADVINLSLGSAARSLLLSQAVAAAAGSGSIVVAAAGNADSSDLQYPAAEDCALAITSVKNDAGKKSSFASYGAWVSLSAPGEKITSTIPEDAYAATSGTSMAAPFVSGQVGLLRSLDQALTLDEIGALIGSTALPVSDPSYPGLLGVGLLDIPGSLAALVAGTPTGTAQNLFAACSGP